MTKRKTRPTAENILKAVGLHRRNNLRAMVGEGKAYATQVDLANALGITDSYLSQMVGPKPIRRITETTARKFEYRLKLKAGALDVAG